METGKTQRLILALETLAILTAAVLILVDYKLKNDLVDLYRKMEATLKHGESLFGENAATPLDSMRVRPGSLVDNRATVETGPGDNVAAQNGQPKTRRAQPANRDRRTRDKAVSDPDKQVGT
jgi:hypothetical protein